MAAVSSYLEQMLSGMDRQLAGFKDECNALAEQHQAWLAETVQTNTKRLQYQTNPVLECPRSHRRPAAKGRRRPLAAVKEVAEDLEDKENASVKLDSNKGGKRGLGMRSANTDASGGEENVGVKRKSDGAEGESECKRAKEVSDEDKQVTKETSRDQLAEINAASEALKRQEAEAAARNEAKAEETTFANDILTLEDVSKMKVPELRKELTRLGLATTGNKALLQERLTEYIAKPSGAEHMVCDKMDDLGTFADSERSSCHSATSGSRRPSAAGQVDADAMVDEDATSTTEAYAPFVNEQLVDAEPDESFEDKPNQSQEDVMQRFTRLRVPELRAELRELGLSDEGKRQELLDRLTMHYEANSDNEQEDDDAHKPKEAEQKVSANELNAAAMFEAALNAESTALFDQEDYAQKSEQATKPVGEPEITEGSAFEEIPKADLSEPIETQMAESEADEDPCGVVHEADSPLNALAEAPTAADEVADATEEMAPNDTAPQSGFQRILQWATPFLGAPPAECAPNAPAEHNATATGDEGYAVCDELERKLEARSARKSKFGSVDTTPAHSRLNASGSEEASEEPAISADAVSLDISATADVAPADVAPADVAPADVAPADVAPADVAPADVTPADGPLADGPLADGPLADEAMVETQVAEAEGPAAALAVIDTHDSLQEMHQAASLTTEPALVTLVVENTVEEASMQPEAAEAEEMVEDELLQVDEVERGSSQRKSAAAVATGAAESAAPVLSALASKPSHNRIGTVAGAKAQFDSRMPKQDERLAKIQKKREDQEVERKAKQEKERQRMEEVRRRREKQEEEAKRALAEKVRRKDEKDVEEIRKQEVARKQAQTVPAGKGKTPFVSKAAMGKQEVGSATAAAASAVPAPKPALPPIPPGWTEHKTPEGRSYYYHAATKKSTWERPCVMQPGSGDAKQYPIEEDRASSDGESESEEDAAAEKQLIPSWAHPSQLQPALIEQFTLDPELVFNTALHEQSQVVDLTSIFGRGNNSRRFHRRTSSGDWSKDRLMTAELHEYRKTRGFQG